MSLVEPQGAAPRSPRGGSPPEPSPSSPEGRRTFARIARWSMPLVSVGVALLTQMLVPRLLQLRFSEAQYTAYVAISSVVAYVALGEGGVLVSLLRQLSALHGAGDKAGFVAEVKRARRIFFFVALIGAGIAAAALGSALSAAAAHWPEAAGTMIVLGAVACIGGASLELAFGSFHTAMLFSTGRLVAGQIAGVVVIVAPIVGFVTVLLVQGSLGHAIWAQAITTGTVAVCRGAHARHLFRLESAGAGVVPPPARLGKVVGSGAALKLAEVMQGASYPHVLSLLAGWLVPVAIPARTYANAVRLVTGKLIDVLQVHVTRGMAGGDAARARAREQYAVVSVFLTAAHLLQLGVASLLVEPVFRLWLPNQADTVAACLPGLFVEQSLLAAAMPTTILLVAGDRMRLLGLVRLAGVPLGLGTMAVALIGRSYTALGAGLAVSALPLFALGLWSELAGLRGMAPGRRNVLARYALGLLAASASLLHGRHPVAVSIVVGASGAVALPWAATRLWRQLRS